MSTDLNFWRTESSLDSGEVYERACCHQEHVEGLEPLPTEAVLRETAAAFPEWTALEPLHYERPGHGSFEISLTPQTVRFDCYSMEQADMRRFSRVLSGFGCPLYDPQLGVRFDRIHVFLTDEAGDYQTQITQCLSRLLPRMELVTQAVTWEEYTRLSKDLRHIHYNAQIHRAKTLTKAVSFLRFGSAWANRPCQCKTAQLADESQARRILGELLEESAGRVVRDFLERTCYE